MNSCPSGGRGQWKQMKEMGTTLKRSIDGLLTAHLLCARYRELRCPPSRSSPSEIVLHPPLLCGFVVSGLRV